MFLKACADLFQIQFVTSLREKLDKKDLRLLLQAIKGYRDDESADLLFQTLKTYMVYLSRFFYIAIFFIISRFHFFYFLFGQHVYYV